MTIHLRPDTWDHAIYEHTVGGEYGTVDFQDKVVADIGAHIGSFSLLAATHGARQVLAFEAGSENFDYLTRNCSSWPSVECTRAAVWASGTTDTALSWRPPSMAENTGGGSVLDCAQIAGFAISDQGQEQVPVIGLDNIIDSVGSIDLLKIDAEGSEYPILFGSQKLDHVGEIVGEYHDLQGIRAPANLAGQPSWSIDGLVHYLSQQGFTVTRQYTPGNGIFRAVRSREMFVTTQ